jgi:hypothetical protein
MDSSMVASQYIRDYHVQTNFSAGLSGMKDKQGEVRDDVSKSLYSQEKAENDILRNLNSFVKSTKDNSSMEKKEDSESFSGFSGSDSSDDSSSSGDSSSYNDSNNFHGNEKELTVLYYMQGARDAAGETLANQLVELENIGSTDDINLVAQYDRKIPQDMNPEDLVDNGWEGVRRYFITRNDNPELKPITLERLLEIEREYPDNPNFSEAIAKKFKDAGNTEKAQKYWNNSVKAKELEEKGIQLYDINDKIKEWHSVVEDEFGGKARFLDNLLGFDRAGEKNITSKVLENLPEVRDGEGPESLQDFVEWGMQNFPAKNYVLVINSHGGASKGCQDISPAEMSDALTAGVNNANEKSGRDDSLDAIIFGACMMGSLEVVSELKDNTDVIIAPQGLAGDTANYQWDDIIRKVQKNIDKRNNFDVKEFANEFVNHFRVDDNNEFDVKYYKGYGDLSAVDTSKIPDLLESFNELLETCEKEGVTDAQLFRAVANSEGFRRDLNRDDYLVRDYSTQVKDFGTFLSNLQKTDDLPATVKTAADKTQKNLRQSIIAKKHTRGHLYNLQGEVRNATGLSIWAPENTVDFDSYSSYTNNVPTFTEQVPQWNKSLKTAADKVPGHLRAEAQKKVSAAEELQKADPSGFNSNLIRHGATFIGDAKKIKEQTAFYKNSFENNVVLTQ